MADNKIVEGYLKDIYEQIQHIAAEASIGKNKYPTDRKRVLNNDFEDNLRSAKKKVDSFGDLTAKSINRTFKSFAKNLAKSIDEKQTRSKFMKLYKINKNEAQDYAKKYIAQTGSGAGLMGGIVKGISKLTGIFNILAGVAQGVAEVFKTLGERNKYYKSAIMFGNTGAGFTNTKGLFQESTNILQLTRDWFRLGAFIGNEKFTNGFRTLLESGALAKTSIDSLLDSYKFVASQGILLGNTFEETAQDISQVASIYNLKPTNANSIESYKYVSRAIELGMQAGLTKSNVLNFILQYSKSTATSSNGFTTVLGDLLTSIKVIEGTNGQQRQQYMSALQSLATNKMSLPAYLGLVERGRSYSKSSLNGENGFIRKYWRASALQSNVQAFEYLSRKKGIGDELTLQQGSQLGLFQGLDNEIGLAVMQGLLNNKSKYNAFMNLKDKSIEGQVKWLNENLGFNQDQRNALERAAMLSEGMVDPMKTIVNILQTMVRYLATIVAAPIFGSLQSYDQAMLRGRVGDTFTKNRMQ